LTILIAISVEKLNSIEQYKSNKPSVVTIGSFDGVHLGHRQVLNDLKQLAKAEDMQSVVISFDPHPRLFFNTDGNLKLLNTDKEKAELLAKTGIDYFILQGFDREFANQSPETYIKKLVENLNMKHLLIGYDHHFGKDRSGNFDYIKSLEADYGFKIHKINPVKVNGIEVSSSLIRELLREGQIEKANSYLGYPYFFSGKVVEGYKLGRKLGFPTANLSVKNPEKLIPKQGVYVVKSVIDNQDVYGMMNIGYRPTVDGTRQIIEVHFLDFNQDLYNKDIPVYFIKRLRDEQVFPDLEALRDQLKKDEIAARKVIALKTAQ